MKTNEMGERIFAPGVSVSNDTRRTGLNNNDLIIGGSGSGKTGGYIYNLLLNPCGSMIVSDTIREIKHVYHETTKFELRSDTVYIHKTDSIRIPAPVSKDVDDDYITDTLTVIVMVLLAGYIFVDRFKR